MWGIMEGSPAPPSLSEELSFRHLDRYDSACWAQDKSMAKSCYFQKKDLEGKELLEESGTDRSVLRKSSDPMR